MKVSHETGRWQWKYFVSAMQYHFVWGKLPTITVVLSYPLLECWFTLWHEVISHCSAVASVQALVDYLWLNKDPSDPAYPIRRRATLCYVTHAIALVLRRSQAVELPEEHIQAEAVDPRGHPSYSHIMPLLVKFTLPLIRLVWTG